MSNTQLPKHNNAILLDGHAVSQAIIERSAEQVSKLNHTVALATVLVGDDAPSRLYVNLKLKNAAKAGLDPRLINLPETVSQAELEKTVNELVADKDVYGILVQLPLPKGIDTDAIINLLPAEKDVDGLTYANMGRLLRGEAALTPCTPLGVMRILEHYDIPTQGKRAVVIGRSYLVGLPQVLLLAKRGVDTTVTICHSRSPDMQAICREADILVAATGQAGLVKADWVKPGAAVLDVGVTHTDKGIRGDVDFDAVSEVAGYITPMPGGTGPTTVACLIENTVKTAMLTGSR